MIVSRQHNDIFLHCRKCAGSSVSVALARHLGPDDLQLTGLRETSAAGIPFTARVEREARAALATLPPVRQAKQRLILAGLYGRARRDLAVTKLVRARYKPRLGAICQHAPAARMRDTFPQDWARATKICIVRNPWDKVVSDYYWRTRNAADPPSFDRFVQAMVDGDPLGGIVPVDYVTNWPIYTIDDRIVADHVVRFETLGTDLPRLMADLSIPFDAAMPRAKGSHRPPASRGDRRSLYTEKTRAQVAALNAAEIETFGYTF